MSRTLLALILISSLIWAFGIFSCNNDDDDDVYYDPGGGGGGGGGDDDVINDDDDDNDDNDTVDDDDNDTVDDDTADDDDDDDTLYLLVIHNDEAFIVDDYADALASTEIEVWGLDEDLVATSDFSGVDVILADTSSNWYSTAAVNKIASLELPVIAVYEAGRLFDNLGLQIGWSPGDNIDFGMRSGIVNQADHTIFKQPYNLNVVGLEEITLYTAGMRLRYHDLIVVPNDVTLLLERPVNSDWSAITIEATNYIYWGYEMDPNYLTTKGMQLLANCIHYLNGYK